MRLELLWCVPAGFAVGLLCVPLFNAVPARWLCDYGEKPSPGLLGKRICAKPEGVLLGVVFSAAFFLFAVQYGVSPVFFLICASAVPLALAAVSDIRYQIIPDECLPAVILPALAIYLTGLAGKTDYYGSWASPFLGALAGGGAWLLVGLLGRAFYRKESVGAGDVKLFAAVGFLCGFPGAVYAFILTILLAGILFLVLMLLRRIKPEQYMPMGPYICAACLLELAFRSRIAALAQWYLSIIRGG